MVGYHTRWTLPEELAEDLERIAIREASAFGNAVYDARTDLGLTVAELAHRAGLTEDLPEGNPAVLRLLRWAFNLSDCSRPWCTLVAWGEPRGSRAGLVLMLQDGSAAGVEGDAADR